MIFENYFFLILIYLSGMFLIYVSTRNIFSFHFMFSAYIAPAAAAASIPVMTLFSLGIFSIGLGCLVLNFFKGYKPTFSLNQYKNNRLEAGILPSSTFILSIYISLFIAVAFSIFYFYKVGISLFSEDVGYQRLVARHDVAGSYIFQRFFRVFMPILCMMYYLIGQCKDTKKYYNTLIFIILLFVTSCFLIFTGMRGNLIIFVLFPFLTLIGLTSKKTSFFRVIGIFILTFSGGMTVSTLMYPNLDIMGLLSLIFARLTTGASDGISFMISSDIIDNGYYYGKTYLNDFLSLFSKLGILNSEFQNYGAYLANSMLGERYNGEQASIFLMGELFANFGNLGLIIGSIICGMFLQYIYIYVIRSNKNIFLLSIFAYFQATFIAILGGPTFSMFLDYFGTITIFSSLFLISVTIFSLRNGKFRLVNKVILVR